MSKLLEKLRKDAEALKERAEKRQSGGTRMDRYKPEKGDNIIRLMPHWSNPGEDGDVYYKPINVHFGVPIKTKDDVIVMIPARCLRDLEEVCPICEKRESGEDLTKEQNRALRVTEQVLYNVLDYKNKCVKTWPCPITLHTNIMEWINEQIGEDVTDPKTGRNWRIKKSVEPGKAAQFGTSYKAFPDMKQSAVPAKLTDLLTDLPNLDEFFNENHREAMCEMLGIDANDWNPAKPKPKAKAASKVKRTKVKVEKEPEEDDGIPTVETAEEEEPETLPAAEIDMAAMNVEDDDLDAELRKLGI